MDSHSHHHKRGSGKKRSHTHKPHSRLPSDLLAYSYKQLKAGKPVSLAGHAGHDEGPFQAIREVDYKGHKITIYTQYEIRVDGEPFSSHIYVDNTGKVSTHALPAYSFVSAVDLVKKIIDEFPEDFATKKKSSRSSSRSKRRRQ